MQDEIRWKAEQEFFDAEQYDEGPIPQNTVQRYLETRKPFLAAEFPFYLMRDVAGARVLDLGCGAGGSSLLLALKGARVTGIDISPRAIEIARSRARLHGLEDRIEFHALPLEEYIRLGAGKFDVICGFALLHHVIPVLDNVLSSLVSLSHDSTRFVFTEPVSLAKPLRRLRLALPLPVQGTPDERPLELEELKIISARIPNCQMRCFNVLLRIWTRFLPGRYEDFSPALTLLYDSFSRLDRLLLSLPVLRRSASITVIYGGPASFISSV